jgi:hypothetical protein
LQINCLGFIEACVTLAPPFFSTTYSTSEKKKKGERSCEETLGRGYSATNWELNTS